MNELPPNPFDENAAPDTGVIPSQDFLANVGSPTQTPPDQAPTQEDYSPDALRGTYSHDPRTIDNPQGISGAFNVLTPFSWFGGAEDAAEERRHPGKGDLGGLAGGGRTYDPKTGMESSIPVIALPPQWQKVMPYGTQFYVYNPKDPSRRVMVTYGDQGPAGYTGKGADLYAQKDIRQHLGLESGEQLGMDLTGVIRGEAPMLSQPPQPGTSYDQQVGNRVRQDMSGYIQQHPESLVAGNVTQDAIAAALKNDNPTRNPDGSLNYGQGVSVYPDTGIIQYETSPGGPVYQDTGDGKLQKFTPHTPPQPPELVKETREAGKPLFNDDGTPKSGLQLQKQLDEYYQGNNLMTPRARQEVDKIKQSKMSSRSPAYVAYQKVLANYDTVKTLSEIPDNERTGADDILLLQAIAAIEAPGRSSTHEDFKQWMQTRGLAGATEVQKTRLQSAWKYFTGQMTKDDVVKQGRVLPTELIPQVKRAAEISLQSRYKVFIQGLSSVANRIKQLGGDPSVELSEMDNPVTGTSPWGEKGVEEAFKPQTTTQTEAQPGTTRTLDPSSAVTWAKANINSPDKDTRDTAEKIISSVGNSGP